MEYGLCTAGEAGGLGEGGDHLSVCDVLYESLDNSYGPGENTEAPDHGSHVEETGKDEEGNTECHEHSVFPAHCTLELVGCFVFFTHWIFSVTF